MYICKKQFSIMSIYINPLTDTGFKIFFGKEGVSEEFLMDFLNELFKGDEELGDIVSLTYQNVERTPESIEEKIPRYDIYCQTNTGHKFIVEMQRQKKPHFLSRTDYYTSRAITDQAMRARENGEWDYELLPVVGVFIADFFIDELEHKLLTLTREVDMDSLRPIGSKIRKAFIQLPAFNKSDEECETGFEKWIYILKNMGTIREIPFKEMNDAVFTRLANVSKVAALSEEERIRYDRDLKWARDYNAEMKYARQTGLAEGRAEGKAEGLIEGRAEGLIEGRVAEKIEIAKKLKSNGIENSIIALSTGLSIDEINAL